MGKELISPLLVFEQKMNFFKSIGYYSTGFGGTWKKYNSEIRIHFYNLETKVDVIFNDDNNLNDNLKLYNFKFNHNINIII